MKVMMFSTVFPAYHMKKGHLTNFIPLIWLNFPEDIVRAAADKYDPEWNIGPLSMARYYDYQRSDVIPKSTTIRPGNHWNVGDVFQPRFWLGTAYRSKQIPFLPELKILAIQKFECDNSGNWYLDEVPVKWYDMQKLAWSDGLTMMGLQSWLNKRPFTGQRIVFHENGLK